MPSGESGRNPVRPAGFTPEAGAAAGELRLLRPRGEVSLRLTSGAFSGCGSAAASESCPPLKADGTVQLRFISSISPMSSRAWAASAFTAPVADRMASAVWAEMALTASTERLMDSLLADCSSLAAAMERT